MSKEKSDNSEDNVWRGFAVNIPWFCEKDEGDVEKHPTICYVDIDEDNGKNIRFETVLKPGQIKQELGKLVANLISLAHSSHNK